MARVADHPARLIRIRLQSFGKPFRPAFCERSGENRHGHPPLAITIFILDPPFVLFGIGVVYDPDLSHGVSYTYWPVRTATIDAEQPRTCDAAHGRSTHGIRPNQLHWGDTRGWCVRAMCGGCARVATFSLADAAGTYRRHHTVAQIVGRLRCQRCGHDQLRCS